MPYLLKKEKITVVDHPKSFHVRPGQVLIFNNGRHYEVMEIISATRCRVSKYRDIFRMLIFWIITIKDKIWKAYGLK